MMGSGFSCIQRCHERGAGQVQFERLRAGADGTMVDRPISTAVDVAMVLNDGNQAWIGFEEMYLRIRMTIHRRQGEKTEAGTNIEHHRTNRYLAPLECRQREHVLDEHALIDARLSAARDSDQKSGPCPQIERRPHHQRVTKVGSETGQA